MSDSTRLDVRVPVGGMFAVVGGLLAVYGISTAGNGQLYARSLHIDVNIWWGLVMLTFGLIMLRAGLRAERVRRSRSDGAGSADQ
jgi:hypothetical protein